MLPRETLATAQIPGGDTLTLVSHGRDFVIMLGRDELMGTRMRFSEEQLAELTLEQLTAPRPRVLIGGYGMGFTFRAALERVPQGGKVTVAEVEELVPVGTLDPDHIHTPGIFVQRIVKGTDYVKRIEQRTVRKRTAA